jgi:hypothetical protein
MIRAACASAGLTSWALPNAFAALAIDVLALPGPGYNVSNAGKSADVFAFNTTVTFGVFATVSGTNSFQQVGDFDSEADADDTRNDEAVLLVAGSFSSVGSLLGNFNAAAGALSYNSRTLPFRSSGSQNGAAQDFDSDGDLDIGQPSPANETDLSALWIARTSDPAYATVFDGVTPGWSTASGASANNADDLIIDPTTSRLRIGRLQLNVFAGYGSSDVNFIPRPTGSASQALWFEDGVATGKIPSLNTFIIGAPVVVSIPEPAALTGVAAALGALGAMGRKARPRQS